MTTGPLRVIVTRSAERDLDRIWTYIATRGSPEAADRVQGDFEAAVAALAAMPGMGHIRPDVKNQAYRFWLVHTYLIVYRFGPDTLTVSRVVSGRQNLRRMLR